MTTLVTMKKWRADDFWFELTEGPSPDGVGFVRYNSVTCRKCGRTAKHIASGQSNDQLRKFFIRENWDIGRARNHHLCPDCAQRNKRRPTEYHPPRFESPQPPSNVVQLRPSRRVTLQEAWEQASEDERLEFWKYLECTESKRIFASRYAPPTPAPTPLPPLYRVIEPGLTHLDWNEIITLSEMLAVREKYGADSFTVRLIDQSEAAKDESTKMVDEFLRQVRELDSPPIEKSPPVEEPIVEPAEDDDEPADWWKEIHECE